MEDGSAFVVWSGGSLDDILGEWFERQVGADDSVSFEGIKLRIPADRHRFQCAKVKTAVLCRIGRIPPQGADTGEENLQAELAAH
jgi:hypothetical protein